MEVYRPASLFRVRLVFFQGLLMIQGRFYRGGIGVGEQIKDLLERALTFKGNTTEQFCNSPEPVPCTYSEPILNPFTKSLGDFVRRI